MKTSASRDAIIPSADTHREARACPTRREPEEDRSTLQPQRWTGRLKRWALSICIQLLRRQQQWSANTAGKWLAHALEWERAADAQENLIIAAALRDKAQRLRRSAYKMYTPTRDEPFFSSFIRHLQLKEESQGRHGDLPKERHQNPA
jgi:hypothetical protein